LSFSPDVFRQAVARLDNRVFHPVQDHVHRADPQHGRVEVKAVEGAVVEVLAQGRIAEQLGMLVAQIFARPDQEPAGAGGGIADRLAGPGLHQRHHQVDDVARGAELAILAGAGDLAQQVLVDVAFGVAISHRHVVELVDHLGQQGRRRDGEAGFLHVPGDRALGGDLLADEGEDVAIDDAEHLPRLHLLEPRPAQILVGLSVLVDALGEDAPLDRLLQRLGLALLDGLQLIQTLDEQQVGQLLHDAEGVGDPARPEVVPDPVDLVPDFADQHYTPPRTRPLALARAISNASRLATTTGVSDGRSSGWSSRSRFLR